MKAVNAESDSLEIVAFVMFHRDTLHEYVKAASRIFPEWTSASSNPGRSSRDVITGTSPASSPFTTSSQAAAVPHHHQGVVMSESRIREERAKCELAQLLEEGSRTRLHPLVSDSRLRASNAEAELALLIHGDMNPALQLPDLSSPSFSRPGEPSTASRLRAEALEAEVAALTAYYCPNTASNSMRIQAAEEEIARLKALPQYRPSASPHDSAGKMRGDKADKAIAELTAKLENSSQRSSPHAARIIAAESKIAALNALTVAATPMSSPPSQGARGNTNSGFVSFKPRGTPLSVVMESPAASTLTELIPNEVVESRVRGLQAMVTHLKQRDDRAGTERLNEIKKVVFDTFQLDIVFLVDVTESMQPSIDMVSKYVQELLESHVDFFQRHIHYILHTSVLAPQKERPIINAGFIIDFRSKMRNLSKTDLS